MVDSEPSKKQISTTFRRKGKESQQVTSWASLDDITKETSMQQHVETGCICYQTGGDSDADDLRRGRKREPADLNLSGGDHQ